MRPFTDSSFRPKKRAQESVGRHENCTMEVNLEVDGRLNALVEKLDGLGSDNPMYYMQIAGEMLLLYGESVREKLTHREDVVEKIIPMLKESWNNGDVQDAHRYARLARYVMQLTDNQEIQKELSSREQAWDVQMAQLNHYKEQVQQAMKDKRIEDGAYQLYAQAVEDLAIQFPERKEQLVDPEAQLYIKTFARVTAQNDSQGTVLRRMMLFNALVASKGIELLTDQERNMPTGDPMRALMNAKRAFSGANENQGVTPWLVSMRALRHMSAAKRFQSTRSQLN